MLTEPVYVILAVAGVKVISIEHVSPFPRVALSQVLAGPTPNRSFVGVGIFPMTSSDKPVFFTMTVLTREAPAVTEGKLRAVGADIVGGAAFPESLTVTDGFPEASDSIMKLPVLDP
jgi:hypothetical protein